MVNIFFSAVFFLMFIPIEKKELTDNAHVKITVEASQKIGKAKSGKISFLLSPAEGIHINTNPAFDFVLEKNSSFEVKGEPIFKKNKNLYLATSSPVIYTFIAKEGVGPGTQTLKGSFRYFYCSDKEGWCNRHVQPIEVLVEISK